MSEENNPVYSTTKNHEAPTELSVDLLATSATSLVKRSTYGTSMPRKDTDLNKNRERNQNVLLMTEKLC